MPRPTRTGPHVQGTTDGRDIPAWTGRARAKALERVKAQGARARTPCAICLQRIDYGLEYPHPSSCSVQHIKSQQHFPHLRWDPRNWAPAHLDCNKGAGNRPTIDLGITDT